MKLASRSDLSPKQKKSIKSLLYIGILIMAVLVVYNIIQIVG